MCVNGYVLQVETVIGRQTRWAGAREGDEREGRFLSSSVFNSPYTFYFLYTHTHTHTHTHAHTHRQLKERIQTLDDEILDHASAAQVLEKYNGTRACKRAIGGVLIDSTAEEVLLKLFST
jgi:hypothetical protein